LMLASRALFGREGIEGPTLLYVFAAAVRA
jgi:hypothetical protein